VNTAMVSAMMQQIQAQSNKEKPKQHASKQKNIKISKKK
jgi:hypothetical protein